MLLIELFYCDVLQIFCENIFLFWCSRAVFVWHATFVIFRNTRQSVIDSAVLLCPCECERDFHLCSTRVKNNTLRAISRVNVKVNPWFRFYLKMHTHFTLGLECVCVCLCGDWRQSTIGWKCDFEWRNQWFRNFSNVFIQSWQQI